MVRRLMWEIIGWSLLGVVVLAATPLDTLVIGENEHPASFDPVEAYDSTVDRMMLCAYDSLISYIPGTTTMIPWIAKSWEVSEDGLIYTLRLQEGVLFHDGNPLTAEDVQYTLDRAKALNIGVAVDLTYYEKSVVINDYEIQIFLSRPYAPFLSFLAKVFVLNKKLTQQHEVEGDWGRTWLKTHEAGSGPYVLKEFRPEEIAIFEKFDNYWRGWEGKHVTRVIWQFIKESATQELLLKKGDIDIAQDPSRQSLAELRADPNIKVVSTPTLATFYIFMNTRKGPLTDKRVRQALAYAYDYEAHITHVINGEGYRPLGFFPKEVPYFYYDPSVFPYEHNLDKARQLLAEAGYPNGGFTLDMAYLPVLSEEVGALEIMMDACAKLGIKIEPRGMTWPTFVDLVSKFDSAPMLSCVYAFPSYPDAHAYLDSQFHCRFVGQWNNYSWYCNETFSKLVEEAGAATDPAVREQLYKQAQIILAEDMPAIPISVINYVVALRSNVFGYAHTPAYHEGVNVYYIYKE